MLARVHGGAVLREARAATGAQPWRPPGGQVPRTFGMIVPDATYYYPEVIKGAREAAGRHGVRLVLGISRYVEAEERAQAEQLLADGVDGLLLTPSGSGGDAPWYAELAVPVVLVERRRGDNTATEHVVTDHAYGARLAVRHLLGLGRKHLGLVLREDSPHADAVREGYEAALAVAGLTAPESALFVAPAPADAVSRDYDRNIEAYLDQVAAGDLDAALVHNDHDALLLLNKLRARGISVPGDLAVVAYDDDLAPLADIPLTAVAPPKRAVGASAVDLLLQRVSDPDRPPHRLSILPELHIRSSTARD